MLHIYIRRTVIVITIILLIAIAIFAIR